ncbi:MAG: hypothetical protein VYE68_06165 [Acidobacteriota bacterium]|nr:hypothetical protein [Acidobacteriota bacterium]
MVGVVATLFVVGCGSSPTFEDAATSNTGLEGGTSVSIPVPAGSGESGDVLVAILGVQGNPNTSGPDGWTAVPGFRGFNGATCQADGQGTACQLAVYTKLADDSDTSASFSWGGTRHAAGAIVRFSNVDSAAPIGAAGPARGSSNEPRAPVITTTRDGSRVLRIVVSELDDARPQLQGTLALTDEPPTFRLNVMSFPDAATDPANGCGPPLAACDATDRAIALAVSDTLNSVAEPSGPATWELPGGDQWVTASIEIIRAPEQ